MARVRSPKKRHAILQAAVHEIAKVGLGAATAKISSSELWSRGFGGSAHTPSLPQVAPLVCGDDVQSRR